MLRFSTAVRALLLVQVPFWTSGAVRAQVLAWGLPVGGPGYEEARGIAVADNGNVCITGEFEQTVEFAQGDPTSALTSQGFSDAFLAWYTNTGELVRAMSFSGTGKSQGYGVAIAPDGTVITTGIFTGTVDLDPGPATDLRTSGGLYDVYLCALSPQGDLLWADVIGGPGNEESRSVVADADGSVYLVGEVNGDFDADPGPGTTWVQSIGSFDAMVAKYAPDGGLLWAHALGGPGDDRAYDITVRPNGEVLITGYFADTMDLDPGSSTSSITASNQWSDAFLACYGTDGNFMWGHGMGGNGTDSGRGVALDSLGNAVVTGRFAKTAYFSNGLVIDSLVCTGGSGDADIFLAKYGPTGDLLWAKGIGGNLENMPRGIATDRTGNILVAGRTKGTIDFDPGPGSALATANGDFDLFLAKYDDQGNYGWAFTAGSSAHARGLNVTTDAVGSVYLTGWTTLDVDIDPGPDTFLLVSHGDADAYLAKFSDQELSDLTLSVQLDAQPMATGWALSDMAGGNSLFFGSGAEYDAGQSIQCHWQVPAGCYGISVADADGNGIDPGGYSLSSGGEPLILADGAFNSISAVAGGEGSCLPMGLADLTDSSCAQQLFGPGDTLHLLPIAQATQYDLWFFDPHGSFSTSVQTNSTAFAAEAMPPGTPAFLPLNVRVRAWINGVPMPYGPACAIRFDGSIGVPSQQSWTSGLTLVPNPVRGDAAMLRATCLPAGPLSVEIRDALGRTVQEVDLMPTAGHAECTLPVHDLANGPYSVVVHTAAGALSARLMVAH
jgi:hypothetical protein